MGKEEGFSGRCLLSSAFILKRCILCDLRVSSCSVFIFIVAAFTSCLLATTTLFRVLHAQAYDFSTTLTCAGVVELAFRLPNSQRLSHRFRVDAYSDQLYSFVSTVSSLPAHKMTISTSFPRKVRTDI
jgi:hypothetical protein